MNKGHIQPPSREEQLIFQGLQRALVEGKARIQINFKLLNRSGSPFFNPWENILPLLAILVISLTVMFIEGLGIGTIVLALLSVVYALLMPFLLKPVMLNRVVKRIIPRIERFLLAWRYGGIVIVLTADQRFYCIAPYGDWRQFTKGYFSDLIPADVSTDSQGEDDDGTE